jgi:putative endonuclease
MSVLNWKVYILECGDGTLYTGITNDLPRRLAAHADGQGAKYTKGRGPLKVIYFEEAENRSEASKREAQIKSISRTAKLALAGL